MTFQVIDRTTGKEVANEVLEKIAKENKLYPNDLDEIFVGEDGRLLLMDDCGHSTYLNNDRFLIVRTDGEYPDFGYCEDLLRGNVYKLHPEFENNIFIEAFSVQMFPQVWSSTAGAFCNRNTVAGACMTMQYTTIITLNIIARKDVESHTFFGIFFGNKLGYIIEHPTKKFFDDMHKHNMKGAYGDLSNYSKE
jgi:hypothetical protein